MAFWTNTDVQLLKKYEYSISLTGLGPTDVLWWVKTVQFPKLSQEKNEGVSGFGGNAVYKPGPTKWQPITLTFADVVLNENSITGLESPISTQMLWFSIADILDSFQQDSGFLTSRADTFFKSPIPFATLSGILNNDKDKIAEILINKHYVLKETKNIVETWRLQDIIISELDFGTGDYSSDDINEVTVTLSYDIANIFYGNYLSAPKDTMESGVESRHNLIKGEKANKANRFAKKYNTTY